MALEGALRDLGLAEVVQLLATGQRTGVLRVQGGAGSRVAVLRFHEGVVVQGRWDDEPDALLAALVACGLVADDDVVAAADWALAQTPPRHVVDGLVETGAVGARTRDAVARRLVDDLCFELTTVEDGSWHFVDDDAPATREPRTGLRLTGEAIFLDAARRRDEWPAIVQVVGSLAAIPALAEQTDRTPLTEPAEAWQLLAAVDGRRTVRQVAAVAGLRVFDAARWVARWLQLGVLATVVAVPADDDAPARLDALVAEATRAPMHAAACIVSARACRALGRDAEWEAHVRRGVQLDPALPEAQLELGYVAAARGDHDEADAAWARYLAAVPTAPDAGRVRAARDAVAHLKDLLSTHAGP
ncbi:MAG: DUF4388 domain-containing protein [Gemmatimonadaceae bacterium]|nr:DUF4388 domain-containing protein [Gemmatimonadaceae bacterium]